MFGHRQLNYPEYQSAVAFFNKRREHLKFLAGILVFIAFLVTQPAISQSFTQQLTNQLEDHPAPYLALHGKDPVAWQEWGAETMEMARHSNRILFLSIGYFSCHWCHVMQRETFRNPEAAKFLNDHFIPVKIDKELEPALDRKLMDFTQNIIGQGGWPLNVFVLPGGYPVYSVLYSPPEQFIEILNRLQDLWKQDPDKIMGLVNKDIVESFPDASPELDAQVFREILSRSAENILARADTFQGGFGEQQKFPSAPQLDYLLDRYALDKTPDVKQFLETTLSAMANGGLYDHLSGGFFRYTVDPGWEIPHFEKMLYDNVNLADVYLKASDVLGRPEFAVIGHQTLSFMSTRMLKNKGGLLSSFSAVDDHNVEGGVYLWTLDQLVEVLEQDEVELLSEIWNLNRPSELPGGNHPRFVKSLEQYAEENRANLDDVAETFDRATRRLLKARDERGLPVDDKQVTGWNAQALELFVDVAIRYPDYGYEKIARQLHGFLIEQVWADNRLWRSWVKGQRMGSASLEDYAYTASALFKWSVFMDSSKDAELALTIARAGWQKFHRNNGWYEGDGRLIAPTSAQEMLADTSTSSPSADLIRVSLELARHFDDLILENLALSSLNRGSQYLTVAPFWYVGQLSAVEYALGMKPPKR